MLPIVYHELAPDMFFPKKNKPKSSNNDIIYSNEDKLSKKLGFRKSIGIPNTIDRTKK